MFAGVTRMSMTSPEASTSDRPTPRQTRPRAMTRPAMIEPTAVSSEAMPNTEPTASAFEGEVELPPIAPLRISAMLRPANPAIAIHRPTSTYLGHSEPSHTYWYLEASPELLALATERLERLEDQR
jgi:hypothetical protein